MTAQESEAEALQQEIEELTGESALGNERRAGEKIDSQKQSPKKSESS